MKAITVKQEAKGNIAEEVGFDSEADSDFDSQDERIAICAYFKAEARGYAPGHEIQDWLEAEAELQSEKG